MLNTVKKLIRDVAVQTISDSAHGSILNDKIRRPGEPLSRHFMGWEPSDDAAATTVARCPEESVVPSHLLQPHLCRRILNGLLDRDGLVPDAIQCDERLMHMISHIVREHGVVVIKSPVVQQMHVIEIFNVHFSRPEGKISRNYMCPITATEAMLTRNSYHVLVMVDIRHSVYVPRPGHEIQGIVNARNSGLRSTQTICTSLPSVDAPDMDVLSPTDDPRLSISLWSSCSTAGMYPYKPEPGFDLISVKLLTDNVLTTLTAGVGGVLCHSSDGPTKDMDELFDLGVRRIIKGQSKVLLQQEQPAFNTVTVYRGMTGKATWVASIRARPQSKMRSTSTSYIFLRCGERGSGADVSMWCRIPYIKIDIPPLALMRILGVANSSVAARMIATAGMTDGTKPLPETGMLCDENLNALESWVRSALLVRRPKDTYPDLDTATREDIMVWVAKSGTMNKTASECIRHLTHLIGNEFMPCMGQSTTDLALARKARVLALIIHRLAKVARGEAEPDDRDHCGNKQVDGAADLLAQLIRQQHRNVVRSFAAHARAHVDSGAQLDVARVFNGRRIGDHEAYSLSTGNWGMQKGGSSQKGAAQHQSRQGFSCTVSQLRRINMQVDRKGKHSMPRQVSVTAWGFICPVESPEGHACGLVKTLALLTRICPSRPFGILWTAVQQTLKGEFTKLGEEPPNFTPSRYACLVWINGVLVGTARHGEHARKLLIEQRRKHVIPYDTELYLSAKSKELYVVAESGGLRRPLLILEPPYTPVYDKTLGGYVPPPPLSADEARAAAALRMQRVRELMNRAKTKTLADMVDTLFYEGCIEYVSPREVDNLIIKMWAAKDEEEWEESDVLLDEWGSDDEDEPGEEQNGSLHTSGGGMDEADFVCGHALSRVQAMAQCSAKSYNVLDDEGTCDSLCNPRPSADAGADERESIDVLPLRLVDAANEKVCMNPSIRIAEHMEECKKRANASIQCGESAIYWAVVERRAQADLAIELCSFLSPKTVRVLPSDFVPPCLISTKDVRDNEEYWSGLRIHAAKFGHFENVKSSLSSKRRASNVPVTSYSIVSDAERRAARRLYLKADRARRRQQLAKIQTEREARKMWEMGIPENDIVRYYASRMRARANRARYRNRRIPVLTRWQAAPYTHAEIHPSAIYGFTTSLLVLFDHNQAPRNAYSDAMIKAAQGVMRDHNYVRASTSMWYPQRPLVTSQVSRVFQMDRHASGVNPIIAVLSDLGDNQEDSKMISQNFVDAGGLRTAVHRSYVEEAREGFGADSQQFKLPGPDCLGIRAASYDHIDAETASVTPGQVVRGGDALICKVMLVADLESSTTHIGKVLRERDQSVIVKSTEGAAIVEAVMRTKGRDGKSYVVVSTREMRIMQRGDKTTNRHGQKGVVSVVVPPDDLPYTKDGVYPDIALNPHAIPSRMTCGMFFEMMAAKAGAFEGIIVDGTVHDSPVTPESVAFVLVQNGFRCDGEEQLFSGKTGKPLRGFVAIGPSYEHRLRQMVQDKFATRETGPVTPLCGQPVEGRSRRGGLRVGEMERDCLIAHGASAVILDRLLEQSDDSIGAVCKKCGLLALGSRARMAHASVESTGPICFNCNTGEHVRSVRFPKAWKVLMQEMMSMNICPRLELEDDDTIDYGCAASVGLRVPDSGQVRIPLKRIQATSCSAYARHGATSDVDSLAQDHDSWGVPVDMDVYEAETDVDIIQRAQYTGNFVDKFIEAV